MKKDNRKSYLQTWLRFLAGKKEMDFKEATQTLGKKFKMHYSSGTLKRYALTLMGNLYGNDYLIGKKGKGYNAGPLTIAKEITYPVLDKCLTRNFSKIKLQEGDLRLEPKKKPAPAGKKILKKKAAPVAKKVRVKKTSGAVPPKPPAKTKKKPPRKRELIRMGQGHFLYAQGLNQQVAELENRLASYERIFDNLRSIFSREFHEMEEWLDEFFEAGR